jgi:hypothetical protein
MSKKIKNIEDIYPLTIITMRYGGKIVIMNTIAENHIVGDLQELEEPHYDLDKWMAENPVPEYYGIGNTLWDAFEDYKKRYYKY